MCGILGIIGSKNDQRLNIKYISHRGPDSSNIWNSSEGEFPVTFAHTRLSILDLSEDGNQPMSSDDGRYIFLFNGEIYNFIELRNELEIKGHIFKTDTDTEVFFKGLVNEGPSFQLRCNGMWSFCLWDRLEKKALFGRDRFGKKPLYYSIIENKTLIFSSEMKGIYPFLESIQPSDNINIYMQKIFDYENSEHCIIKGIKRLPLGHYGIYSNGNFNIVRWWNTLDHLEDIPIKYEDQVEQWREIFLDSVKIRMRSDVRIGTALSGGLDSSAIFSAMSYLDKDKENKDRQSKDWQNGFCAHFPGSSLDEYDAAKKLTDTLKLPIRKITINPTKSKWTIEKALFHVEDPYLTLPLPMLDTYKAISQAGIKVTLDGHGADEMFAGYGHLKFALFSANSNQIKEIISIIKSLKTNKFEKNDNTIFNFSIKYRLIELINSNLKIPKDILKSILGKQEWELFNYKLNYSDQKHEQFKQLDPLSRKLYEIFHITILPTLLRNYDRYSMASGVEIRMPFMDHRLVTYTFSLPWTSKVGGTFTKRIMRDALKGILPDEIRTRRRKIGWNSPLHEWLKGPLKNLLENENNLSSLPEQTKKEIKRFLNTKDSNFSDGQRIWNFIMPILWRNSILSKNY